MLLSRVAADLFWLARYTERAENTARILDVASRLSAMPTHYGGTTNEWESAVLATGSGYEFAQRYDEANRRNVIDWLAFSQDNPSSIRSCLDIARRSARSVRTALTREMWEAINDGWLEMRRYSVGFHEPAPAHRVPVVRQGNLPAGSTGRPTARCCGRTRTASSASAPSSSGPTPPPASST